MSPDGIEQIFLPGQLAGLLRERAEHCKCFRRQSDRTAALGEQSVLLIQLELVESKRSGGDFAHGGSL